MRGSEGASDMRLNHGLVRGIKRIQRVGKGKGPDARPSPKTQSGIPEWELLGHTPAVFRKSAHPFDCREVVKRSLRKERKEGRRRGGHLAVFVKADSKGVTGVTVWRRSVRPSV